MFLFKRKCRFLKVLFAVALSVTCLMGMMLLNTAHYGNETGVHQWGWNFSGITNNHIYVLKHPRNIFPAIINHKSFTQNRSHKSNIDVLEQHKLSYLTEISSNKYSSHVSNTIVEQEGEDKSVANCIEMDIDNTIEPNQNVHTFYYPWYGNPGHDGRYLHWNHVQISHWDKNEARKWPQGQHEPPDDVGSNFYPQLGPYSSSDPGTISCHMRMMRYAGIGVLAVSWYPPGDGDQNGLDPDTLLPLLLDTAYTHGLKVALHVEPFKGRDHLTMKSQLRYIMEKYGPHPAFYRTSVGDKLNLPLLYIYDSYLTSADKWAEIMKPGGRETVRGTELDAIFIGLLVERTHQNEILKAGFDGFYTYFASNGFVYGSTWNNWPLMSKWAKSNRLLFIPSVGPGYVDTEVRPWNQRNTKLRLDGKYYRQSVENALSTGSTFVSITSFNEWHEGSQIEPAVKKLTPSRKYEDYGVKGPLFYLDLTKEWVQRLRG
ncbi:glycoprotein endo-alpha-1,2-mannosidase-like [Mya arenaria]|uniref:glycoprotein endo-alpha-1,2-mannosidase-like n=1 Tax=Mya arenaria TaxID=6604 RepID=UPI0022E452CE|nr:glycoprotein endo-alpha-1,2-mannosidase-like [Mya arenaria]